MNDTELDTALRNHASHWRNEFNAPPLAGRLELAVTSKHSRLRWAAPLIAAVLLLVIPLITVLSLHHHARSAPAIAPKKKIPLGVLSWKNAVLQDDGAITLSAEPASDTDFCKYSYSADAVVSQSTATSITITVTQYQDGPADLNATTKSFCADGTGHLVGSLAAAVRLAQPLGNRSLIDARDGTRHSLLDASTVPKAGYIPPGFTARGGVSWDEASADHIERTYVSAKGEFNITKEKYDPENDFSGWDRSARGTGTVLGHPAKYLIWGGDPHVSWLVDGYLWTVGQSLYYAAATGYLDQAQLFKIANSIR